MRATFSVMAASVMLLGACAEFPGQGGLGEAQTAKPAGLGSKIAVIPQPLDAAPRPPAWPDSAQLSPPVRVSAPAPEAVAFQRPEEKPEPPMLESELFNPDALVGLDPDSTVRLLGIPPQMREEPPAKVWVYKSGSCSLDVFFYLDVESDNFHALAYDVNVGDGGDSDSGRDECLKIIKAAYGTTEQ